MTRGWWVKELTRAMRGCPWRVHDGVRKLVLPVWSDFRSSLNSPSPPGGGINPGAGRGEGGASLWETSV